MLKNPGPHNQLTSSKDQAIGMAGELLGIKFKECYVT